MKLEFSQQIFKKYIKFHENPFSGSQVVPCVQIDGRMDRQTDMTKLIASLCNFANAPNKKVRTELMTLFHVSQSCIVCLVLVLAFDDNLLCKKLYKLCLP